MKSGPTRPWLVGELNPYGADPDMALYPLPEYASGGRLARILGLSRTEYLRSFERRNLCVGKWSMKAARIAAAQIEREADCAPLVLLGAKVCDAFGFEFKPFVACVTGDEVPRSPVVRLPHPSGLSRLWNEPGAAGRARDAVLPLLQVPA